MEKLELKLIKPATKLNTYDITVVGKYNNVLPYETKMVNVDAEMMNDFVLLFLSYIGNPNLKHIWKGCKFGEDFKHGPLQIYLGAFTDDCHYPCIDLLWSDVISVELTYIDHNSTYYKCRLPEIEELYTSEEEFLEDLKFRFNEFNKRDPRDKMDDGTELVDSYELELVRNVLRSTGKWDDKELDNLFFINRDIGFSSLGSMDSNSEYLLKILNQERAKSATGVEYKKFYPETFKKLQDVIMRSDLSEETKTFVIDICGKYNKDNILSDFGKREIKKIVESFDILHGSFGGIGPNLWSGIYLQHVINPDMIDFDDYDENEVIKYNGETYIIHEGD